MQARYLQAPFIAQNCSGTDPRRRFYLIRPSGLSLIDLRRFLSYDRVVNDGLLTFVVIFFVVFVVAMVTASRIPSGPRRRKGHRRDPLYNGSADGEHITD